MTPFEIDAALRVKRADILIENDPDLKLRKLLRFQGFVQAWELANILMTWQVQEQEMWIQDLMDAITLDRLFPNTKK